MTLQFCKSNIIMHPIRLRQHKPLSNVLEKIVFRGLSTREKSNIRRQTLDQFLRVDHAGEYGADRIYAGQAAVLGQDLSTEEKRHTHNLINHMWEQEKEHLRTFERLIPEHQARPTILLPIWHVAGYVLGAGGALLGGARGAMAVTVAVEASITEHYNNQIRTLIDQSNGSESDEEMIKLLTRIRDEEQEHHDTGLEEEAEKWWLYEPATNVVKAGCKVAIWLSERI